MGWWPFSNDEADTFKDLDPELKEFLDAEKLSASSTSSSSSSSQPTAKRQHRKKDNPTYRGDLDIEPPTGPPARPFERINRREAEEAASAPTGAEAEVPLPVPSESLYQDGRYAHLWKGYKSAAQIEAEGKSDSEKLSDILHAYKSRRHELKQAALENCASAQINLSNCFKSGRWKTRLRMCKEENQELERCAQLQSKLLRALGFMSMWERSEEEGERIQMHADRLYQRMLREEAEAAEARAKGLEPPPVRPLIRERRPDEAPPPAAEASEEVVPVTDEYTWDNIKQERKDYYLKEKWKDYSPNEVELAKKDWNQQLLLARTMSQRMRDRELDDFWKKKEREQKGEVTFGDRLKNLFDMREYPETAGEEKNVKALTEAEKQ